jgi:hypothetical protein
MVTFEQVWAAEFAPQVAAARRVQTERRTEAFLEITHTVCGEELRQMTPADLLHLDALANPYVCGGLINVLTPLDSAALIWQLAAQNTHESTLANLWRRTRLLRRLAKIHHDEQITALLDYVARQFADLPGAEPDSQISDPQISDSSPSSPFAPEPPTYFLAPLLLRIAAEIGPTDPMTGALLSHTPLARLAQYQRTIDDRHATEKQYTATDSLRNRCMDRVNQLNAAARQAQTTTDHTDTTDQSPSTMPSSVQSVPSVVKNSEPPA